MAMKMGGVQKASGFTIVETLIVLAVTSALLVAAMSLINGKQAKTEFQTGMNSLRQQFQQIINETSSGYYPNNSTFRCQPSVGSPVRILSGSNAVGTNGGCIFLGKVVHLGAEGSAEKYTVFSLAANRTFNGKEVTTYTDARPTAIARAVSYNTTAPNDLLVKSNTPYGLAFAWGRGDNSPPPPIGTPAGPFAIAFLSSLATYNATGDTNALISNSQQFGLHGFIGPWVTYNTTQWAANNIDNEASFSGSYPSLTKARMCFASGGTNQSGLITITQSLSVTLEIRDGKWCA